ncbi:MAG: serine/threonine protein kinase [Phycisphaeraceae bacterium]|nr:MAG: serine/threonine protein kinase [Phycisphaeraceae bacterium]
MDPDRARRAHAILTAALGVSRAEREQMVVAACEGDPALESKVRKLLAASDMSTGFLDRPALTSHSDIAARVPDAVGSYLVVGVLGAGGMATVYEAVQENPHRRVALKVMHQSMTNTDAYLRFRIETETLARLRHPGIAQIYEAGTAQLGLPTPSPFFAMELVPEASTITEHARSRNLSLRDRVAMFASVCDAVLHGHQHGVIHRDIKPGNILVGPDGVPKVIDFGIARTTGAASGPNPGITAQTRSTSLLGTLNSMSPEQCASPDSIDVRSDVYSLGVVLYELVTDRLPHDLSKRSIPEAIRIITQEPVPDAGKFRPEARGDLSAIIAKALEKDRENRYVGAAALAADLRRWLAFEPIEARPATAAELIRKFIRRNPPLAGAIGFAAIALIAGTAVSARFAYVATKARDQALQREQELEAITEFQGSLLRGIDVADMGDRLRASLAERVAELARLSPESDPSSQPPHDALTAFARLTDPVNFTSIAVRSLRESILARYAASIDTQFAAQPHTRARLLQQLAETMNTLGLYNDAEPTLRTALELRRETFGENHPDTLQSLHALGSLLSTLGRNDEAVEILKDAHARRAALFGRDHQLTLRTGTSLGGAYRRLGNLDEAHRVWSETLRSQRIVLGDDHPDTLRTLNNVGIVLAMQNRPEDAEACWRELLERRRRTLGEDHPEYRSAMSNLGVLLQDQGKFSEARELMEHALASDRRTYGDTHKHTLVAIAQLASLLIASGDLPGAETLQRECYAGRVATLGPEHPDTLRALASLGAILNARGDKAQAIEHIARAHDLQRSTLGESHPDTIESANLLAGITNAPADAPSEPQATPSG